MKPGVQHPQRARCYLKSTVPGTRRSNCCSSGVKGVDYGTDRPDLRFDMAFEDRPDVDLDHLTTVRFLFDRTAAGNVVMDDIGFSNMSPDFLKSPSVALGAP